MSVISVGGGVMGAGDLPPTTSIEPEAPDLQREVATPPDEESPADVEVRADDELTPGTTDTAGQEPEERKPRPVRIPTNGSGTFDRAKTVREIPDAVLTYSIEVERNLPIPLREFATVVRRTLADPRGWTGGDPAELAMTDGDADFRIVLTTPGTTDQLCAPLQTRGRVSCRNGENVVINAVRWVKGAPSYGPDLLGYRRYVINHEVGHALGNGHVGCPESGALSPVMLQQTLGLQGCRSNPWPARADLID